MMRLHPALAFVVTTLVMTLVLGGVVIAVLLLPVPEGSYDLGPTYFADVPGILGLVLVCVAGAGAIVGLPILALLHWIGVARRKWALLLAGFLGGFLFLFASIILTGAVMPADPFSPALMLGGLGMAAGFSWWFLTGGAGRDIATARPA